VAVEDFDKMSLLHVGILILVCSAVGIFLIGLFHYLNTHMKDVLYEESGDEDYNEYMIWKKL